MKYIIFNIIQAKIDIENIKGMMLWKKLKSEILIPWKTRMTPNQRRKSSCGLVFILVFVGRDGSPQPSVDFGAFGERRPTK